MLSMTRRHFIPWEMSWAVSPNASLYKRDKDPEADIGAHLDQAGIATSVVRSLPV